jgi:hypothetical protein
MFKKLIFATLVGTASLVPVIAHACPSCALPWTGTCLAQRCKICGDTCNLFAPPDPPNRSVLLPGKDVEGLDSEHVCIAPDKASPRIDESGGCGSFATVFAQPSEEARKAQQSYTSARSIQPTR